MLYRDSTARMPTWKTNDTRTYACIIQRSVDAYACVANELDTERRGTSSDAYTPVQLVCGANLHKPKCIVSNLDLLGKCYRCGSSILALALFFLLLLSLELQGACSHRRVVHGQGGCLRENCLAGEAFLHTFTRSLTLSHQHQHCLYLPLLISILSVNVDRPH